MARITDADWVVLQQQATRWLRMHNRDFSGALINFEFPTSRMAEISLTQGVGSSLLLGATYRLWLREPRLGRVFNMNHKWVEATVTNIEGTKLIDAFAVPMPDDYLDRRVNTMAEATYYTLQDYAMIKGVHNTVILDQVIDMMNCMCDMPFNPPKKTQLDSTMPLWKWAAVLCPSMRAFQNCPAMLITNKSTVSMADRVEFTQSLRNELAWYIREHDADRQLASVMIAQAAVVDSIAPAAQSSPLVLEVANRGVPARRGPAPAAKTDAAGRFPPVTSFLNAAKVLLKEQVKDKNAVEYTRDTVSPDDVCKAMGWWLFTLTMMYPKLSWSCSPNRTRDRYEVVGHSSTDGGEVRIQLYSVPGTGVTNVDPTTWLDTMPTQYASPDGSSMTGDHSLHLDFNS